MAERRRHTAKEKGKAKVGEPILIDSSDDDDDQTTAVPVTQPPNEPVKIEPITEEDPPRSSGGEVYRLSKVLNPKDVLLENPLLHFDDEQTYVLLDSLKSADFPPGSYPQPISVYDESMSREYKMVLTLYVYGSNRSRYIISEEWKDFVLDHNLRTGDVITIFKNLDFNFYMFKYSWGSSKKEGGDAEKTCQKGETPPVIDLNEPAQNLPDKTEENVSGSASRDSGREVYRLSKTLDPDEAEAEFSTLYLDDYEASMLFDLPQTAGLPPGSYGQNIVVYDEGMNRKYNMQLTILVDLRSNISYTISQGWDRFIKEHNLEAGDEISIYKNFEKDCFIFKKEPDDELQVLGENIPPENVRSPSKIPVIDLNEPAENVPEKTKENVPRSGSRGSRPEVHRVSRILDSHEVLAKYPVLYFSAKEARIIFDPPETGLRPGAYSRHIDVYDENTNTKYTMLLTRVVDLRSNIRHSISEGWKKYIEDHNLKPGDVVFISRTLVLKRYIIECSRVDAAKTSQKESEQDDLQLLGDNIPPELVGLPSEKPFFKVIYHQAQSDINKKKVPGPGSRAMPRDAFCLSKVLSASEVVEDRPKLYFNSSDAIMLTGISDIEDYRLGKLSKELMVFDGNDRKYNMKLSHHIIGLEIGYSLNTGWNRFVRTHNLKQGDVLTFYRFLNAAARNSVDQYCYVLKYFRKPADPVDQSCNKKKRTEDDEDDVRKDSTKVPLKNTAFQTKKHKPIRPGSRELRPEDHCLTKSLVSFEVSDDTTLYFDCYEANLLAKSPGNLKFPLGKTRKIVVVYDVYDRRYNMLLHHFAEDGDVLYLLELDWVKFVKNHDLKEGDEIAIYRIVDMTVHPEPYYVIKKEGVVV